MGTPLLQNSDDTNPQAPLISLVRLANLSCRTAPRGSVEGCAILDPNADAGDFIIALSRILPTALERRPVFWAPGTSGLSFDEAWLLALSTAIRSGDADSERFLLTRRTRPNARPILRMLIAGLFDRLESG